MDLAGVKAALGSLTISGWDFKDSIPNVIYPPTVAVGRMRLDYNKAFGGLAFVEVTLHAFASMADNEQGQSDLLALMETDGLKATVEADKTLGGTCQTLNVESSEGPGLVDVNGQQYWSSSWTVRVYG